MADQLSSSKFSFVCALQMLVGFTLNNVLATCNSWPFSTRSQKWLIKAAALRILHISLATPLASRSPFGIGRQYVPDWSLAKAVAEAVSRPGAPAGYLFVNLPPPEGKCSVWYMPTCLQGSAVFAHMLCSLASFELLHASPLASEKCKVHRTCVLYKPSSLHAAIAVNRFGVGKLQNQTRTMCVSPF